MTYAFHRRCFIITRQLHTMTHKTQSKMADFAPPGCFSLASLPLTPTASLCYVVSSHASRSSIGLSRHKAIPPTCHLSLHREWMATACKQQTLPANQLPEFAACMLWPSMPMFYSNLFLADTLPSVPPLLSLQTSRTFKNLFRAFSMTFLKTATGMHILNDIWVDCLSTCRRFYIANSQRPFQVSNQGKTTMLPEFKLTKQNVQQTSNKSNFSKTNQSYSSTFKDHLYFQGLPMPWICTFYIQTLSRTLKDKGEPWLPLSPF